MSGTSLDGIDVAIVDITGAGWNQKPRIVAYHTRPYPRAVRAAILGVSNALTHTASIARLHFLLPELYAEALFETSSRARLKPGSIDLIGCHGQTIFHEGTPVRYLGRRVASTLQIGDGSVLAERTGIPVVFDFRPRDIAAGGCGAPLVPYVDYLLYRHAKIGRVALNIGGIANLTAIPPAAGPEEVVAFDTGPGNMVVDALVERLTVGKKRYDAGGRIAARGRLIRTLLDELLEDPFYALSPPKSAGREQYGREFVDRLTVSGHMPPDLITTATVLTAATIALGVDRFVRRRMRGGFEIVVSGGGARNPVIMRYLTAFLPNAVIRDSSEFGIPGDAKEAIAFAVLAYESRRGRPANLPSATGARRAVVLGKLSPGRS